MLKCASICVCFGTSPLAFASCLIGIETAELEICLCVNLILQGKRLNEMASRVHFAGMTIGILLMPVSGFDFLN